MGQLKDQDWEDLRTMYGALSDAQIAWLRTAEFATPWLDRNARCALEIAPLVAVVRDRPFPAELRLAVGDLSNALTTFAAYYAQSTFPDPRLVTDEWRFFNWDDGETIPRTDAPFAERSPPEAADMQELSLRVCDAYEGVVEIIRRNRKMHKRVQAHS